VLDQVGSGQVCSRYVMSSKVQVRYVRSDQDRQMTGPESFRSGHVKVRPEQVGSEQIRSKSVQVRSRQGRTDYVKIKSG